jgi:thiamine pyrophosphokinase
VEEFEESRAPNASAVGQEGGGAGEMDIVILGGLSGRLDQTMHTLHVLCQVSDDGNGEGRGESTAEDQQAKKKNKGIDEDDFVTLERRKRTWVLSENSLLWILNKVSK